MIQFNNTYTKLPDCFYELTLPEKFHNPELIIFNKNLAKELGINFENLSDKYLADVFSGQEILDGSDPLAMAYAGFQFGHPVWQLGDGRAHYLGEVNGYDIQLKGSGQTSFSRGGDGRSPLGSVLREYILSEAMHALGVPTSRALCAVSTGEHVVRQFGVEPGGILTRVSSSHIRVGTFQYFMFRDDIKNLKILFDYTVKRHFPDVNSPIELLKKVIDLQSDLISKWMSLGFIHGVMNTDNFSIAGITLDYGPCAFLDEYDSQKVFSSVDQGKRYSFSNQIPIAKWNILRLADCLLPLIDSDQKVAIKVVEDEVLDNLSIFDEKKTKIFSEKLGLKNDDKVVSVFLKYLEEESLDFTLAFRNLTKLYEEDFSFYPQSSSLKEFHKLWKSKEPYVDNLNQINPLYIPRNHQVQKSIDYAYDGDFTYFNELIHVLESPFIYQSDRFSDPPQVNEKVTRTFCGT